MSITAVQAAVVVAGKQVLAPTSLTITPGESIAIVGQSGSGKTTLLNTLSLLLKPANGTVNVDSVDTSKWNDARRRKFWRDHAAFIFQDYGLIDEESVAYNIVMAAPPLVRLHTSKSFRVEEVLEAVGLAGRSQDKVSTLSGGEKQRVGLARATYKQATYIFADEPTASLDEANRELVTRLLHRETERGAAIIIATHDETLAATCDSTHRLVSTHDLNTAHDVQPA